MFEKTVEVNQKLVEDLVLFARKEQHDFLDYLFLTLPLETDRDDPEKERTDDPEKDREIDGLEKDREVDGLEYDRGMYDLDSILGDR